MTTPVRQMYRAKKKKGYGQLKDPYGIRDPEYVHRDGRGIVKGSRFSALTQAVADAIVEMKRIGTADHTAAEYAGVSWDSLRLWKTLGREEIQKRHDEDYEPDHSLDDVCIFYKMYLDASIRLDKRALIAVGTAIEEGNVDMAWKWLQARHPETYNPAKKVELSGRDGGAIEITPVIRDLPAKRLDMLKLPEEATGAVEDE